MFSNYKGSKKWRRLLNRNRARGHLMLVNHYFSPDALFEPYLPHQFWMRWQVFDPIYHDIQTYDDYFILKKGSIWTIGFSSYHKCGCNEDACLWHYRRFRRSGPLDVWKHMRWSDGQIFHCSGEGVWTVLLEGTNSHSHSNAHGNWRIKRFNRYVGIHGLHAPKIEELPIC